MKNKNRNKRAEISQETLDIIEKGSYRVGNEKVELAELVNNAMATSKLIRPHEHKSIDSSLAYETVIEVMNETTLQGAKRLSDSSKFKKIGVLNFASAKNAGGGFLGGSQAQEESLARNSALYATLEKHPEYYEYHRKVNKTLLYSHHMIYSPDCPVFRLDDGTLLEKPYLVDFLTSPAPNRGAIAQNEPNSLDKIDTLFAERIEHILNLFLENGCDALVLGAWGCGVFRNSPEMVAKLFAEKLLANGKFLNVFKYIVFSIPENPKNNVNSLAFEKAFSR